MRFETFVALRYLAASRRRAHVALIATISVNIAANVVSPAYDLSNLAPKFINFRTGALITGVIGILIFPWKLIEIPGSYIFTWLGGYSSLLGPIGGIMIVDYYFIRKQKLNADDLYSYQGAYNYRNGFNRSAIIALLCGIIPNIPGFLLQISVVANDAFPAWVSNLYHFSWFIGFLISGISYTLLMRSYKTIINPQETAYVAVD